ncbi:hypothetical protein ACLMJK_009707 [Lecanora helva]
MGVVMVMDNDQVVIKDQDRVVILDQDPEVVQIMSDEDDEAAGSDTDYPDTESPEVQYRRDLEYVLRSETLRVPQPTASKSLPPLKSLNLPDSRQVPQTNTEQRDPTAMIQVD